MASGRPAYGSRFNTGNMESALLARGFHYGSAPNSVVIGWNGGHAAVTLPDGTPVSSGESNHGVRIGGGGAYQPQFNHHMYLPVEIHEMKTEPAPGAEPAAATADMPAPADLPAPVGLAGPADLPGPADFPAPPPADALPPVAVPDAAPQADPAPPADPAQATVIDLAGNGPLPGPSTAI